jgi:hypothetical protein
LSTVAKCVGVFKAEERSYLSNQYPIAKPTNVQMLPNVHACKLKVLVKLREIKSALIEILKNETPKSFQIACKSSREANSTQEMLHLVTKQCA